MIAAIMRAQPMPLFKLSALSLALSPVAHIFLHSTTGQSIYILQQQGNLKSDAWEAKKVYLSTAYRGFDSTNFRVAGIPCRHC